MNPFEKPNLMTAKRVLAIQPHYDDNDIGAGGTLAALVKNGAELFYLTVTDDLLGVIDPALSDDAARECLMAEQFKAGEIIGVQGHHWLEHPDAGISDYLKLRQSIIQYIRMIQPDFIFTCDPWMVYEAHQDHVITGRATAEATILFSLKRVATVPEVDEAFFKNPTDITGIAFYGTSYPNTVFNITGTQSEKHEAIQQYQAQFTPDSMQMLLKMLEIKEAEFAFEEPFSYGEILKVLRPFHLHGYPQAIST